jgi:fatty acid-binding protein DegV
MHKPRGERRALETLVSCLETEGCRSGRISIGHCQNESGAEQLKSLILERFHQATVEIHPFRGLCSFYAEKGGILVGFEKK